MITILLIEDEDAVRHLNAAALELEGYTVLHAANGAAGLKCASSHRPNIILCDVMMHGLDGYEVLAALRANPDLCQTPFIFLTARGEKKDLRLGMTSGADDYLTKPVGLDDLLAAISARLARHAQQVRQQPDFSSPAPLRGLGLTGKESEVLLWVAQGKTNAETGMILGVSEATIKKHLEHIYEKLGVENRGTASLLAIELLAA